RRRRCEREDQEEPEPPVRGEDPRRHLQHTVPGDLHREGDSEKRRPVLAQHPPAEPVRAGQVTHEPGRRRGCLSCRRTRIEWCHAGEGTGAASPARSRTGTWPFFLAQESLELLG